MTKGEGEEASSSTRPKSGDVLLSDVSSHVLVEVIDVHELLERSVVKKGRQRSAFAGEGTSSSPPRARRSTKADGDRLDDVEVVLEVDDDVLGPSVQAVVEQGQSLWDARGTAISSKVLRG